MADNIDVNVNVNTTTAQRNLANLNKQVDGLQKTFGALQKVIGTIAFGSIINNSLRFAASMVDVSNSTDIALEAVLGFSRAVQDNGGSLESAQAALQKFNLSIAEAADGSASLQQAFQNVNVSLNDLRTLSQQDLLQKTIKGLAQIRDASERARIATELMGKSFRGVDILGLANEYAKSVEESRKYVSAIRSADEVQRNLEQSTTNFQIALLAVLKPISDLAKGITSNIDAVIKWISVIVEVVKVIGGLFLLGRLFQLIGRGINAIKGFAAAWKSTKLALKEVQQQSVLTNKGILKAIQGVETFIRKNPELAKFRDQFIKLSDAAKTAGMAILGFIGSITGITVAYNKWNEVTQQQNLDDVVNYIDQLNESSTEAWMTAQQNAEEQRKVTEALLKEKQAIQEVTAAYQRSNAEQIAAINIQRLSLDMSRDEVEVMNAVDEVIKRNEESVRKLKDQKASLATDSPLIPAIEKEIKALEDSLEQDKRNTAQAVRNLQIRQLEQEKLNHVLEQTNAVISQGASLQALQDQLSLVGQYGQELENNLVRLDVQRELESTLNALAVRALELEQQRVQLGEQRYQQEMNNLLALTDVAYRYADARLEAEKKILDAQRATQQNAKLGTEQAIADIAKQFEPYNMAQEAVKKGWDAIGNAVDKFVETGKFKFSDFARSVLADLAKMIAKAMIFKAISGIAGSFGLSIPGLAAGGPAKAGQPYIVGEKGPELFVPKQSGTVVPNNQLGATKGEATGAVNAPVTNNYITNNINALDARSVAQLFAENRKTLLGSVIMAQKELPYATNMM